MNSKLILLLLLCLLPLSLAYTLDGSGGVYWQNTYGKISQYPAYLTDIQNIVYLNITSNITGSINLDSAFEFDTSVIKPIKAEYWGINVPHEVPNIVTKTVELPCKDQNVTPICNYTISSKEGTTTIYYDDWSDISNKFAKKEYLGKTYYAIENVTFSKGQTRQLKLTVIVAPNTKGKYGLRMKRSSDSWLDVISDLVPNIYLDPWWDSNWSSNLLLNFSCPGIGCSNNVATPLYFDNATLMTYMGANGSSLRYITECGSGNFSQRGIWVQKWNPTNASIWINYTNDTTCSHYFYFNNTNATSVSSPYNIFDLYDEFYSATGTLNASLWSYLTLPPLYLTSGRAELNDVSTSYLIYTISNFSNYTAWSETMQRTATGRESFVGTYNPFTLNLYYGYYLEAIGQGSTNRTVNSYGIVTDYLSIPTYGNGSMVTNLDKSYLYQYTITSTKFNFSRQATNTDELASNSWTPYNETIYPISPSMDERWIPGYVGGSASNNASIFWSGITLGIGIPIYGGSSNYTSNATPAPNASSYVNIKTYDEITLNQIYFDVSIHNSTQMNTSSSNFNYSQPTYTLPVGSVTIQASNTSYHPRIFYSTFTTTANNTVTAYLLPTNASVISVNFNTQTTTGATISDALIQIKKMINGTYTTIGEMKTDATGVAHFWLDQTVTYQIVASHPAYNTYITTINPVFSTYIIYMTASNVSARYESGWYDITWSYSPVGGLLNFNYTQNFSFSTHSNNNSIVWTAWRIYNGSTLLYYDNQTGSSGTTLNRSFKPGPNASIIIYYYVLHTNQSNQIEVRWYVPFPGFWILDIVGTNLEQSLGLIGSNGYLHPLTIAISSILIGVMVAGWVAQFSMTGGVVAFLGVLSTGMYILGINTIYGGGIALIAILTTAAYYLWRSGG